MLFTFLKNKLKSYSIISLEKKEVVLYEVLFDFNKGIELFTNWYQTNKNNLYK